MRRAVVLGMLVGILFSSANLYAYNDNAASKLGRGLANGLVGWLELPRQVYISSKEYDALTGIAFGTVKGAFCALLRTGAGFFEILTFPFPPYDKPILEPEFVFEDWE
ncbi:MAG: exosortase system-associated protein, TIGR04073 family [Candidatus Omnitrophota bacterium]|nr:MAG: exosortase system-associated protein, TIGR04073 family [Candidatus Omnitrophota bacterium]